MRPFLHRARLRSWGLALALLALPLVQASPSRAADTRTEHDSLGEKTIPNTAYYGVQTMRALESFPFNTRALGHYPAFLKAFALVKKAAALANNELGILSKEKKDAIVAACDEIIAGKLRDQFPIDMFQGGAGTSTNRNVNEVIANRGLELLGHKKGEYTYLHPNDDVNLSQSDNDSYSTAAKLAIVLEMVDTLTALDQLKLALSTKAMEFEKIIKMGRTEMQDAVPVTLGQEFAGFADTLSQAVTQLTEARTAFMKVNLGGAAIGTGLGTPPGYSALSIKKLAELTGYPFVPARDLVGASSDGAGYLQMSGAMKRTGIAMSKIANDLRLMSSGPRAGFAEITLPAVQPESSTMPGMVNPVIPEVVSSIAYQLAGFDTTVTMAAESSSLERNPMGPVIVSDELTGMSLLGQAARVLAEKCVNGIKANVERCREMVQNSIGLVTALIPVLGDEKSAAIAKESLKTGRSVSDLVLAKGWMTKEALDDLLRPENMTKPRDWPKKP